MPQFVGAFWLGHKLAFSLTLNLRDGDGERERERERERVMRFQYIYIYINNYANHIAGMRAHEHQQSTSKAPAKHQQSTSYFDVKLRGTRVWFIWSVGFGGQFGTENRLLVGFKGFEVISFLAVLAFSFWSEGITVGFLPYEQHGGACCRWMATDRWTPRKCSWARWNTSCALALMCWVGSEVFRIVVPRASRSTRFAARRPNSIRRC